MLASILPGVRGVRAPLAAGSLLLAALYVACYTGFQAGTHGARLGPGLDSLLRLLGRQGRLAVLGVAVYLVGTVFVLGVQILSRNMSLRRIGAVLEEEYQQGERSKLMVVVAPFSTNSARRLLALCQQELEAPAVTDDVRKMPKRVCHEIVKGQGKLLLARNKDLYVEWDRMQAEAELRDAVALPAMIFVVVALFALDWTWWAKVIALLSAVGVAALLWGHARRLEREANSVYAHFVADGIVTTDTIVRAHEPANTTLGGG